MNTPTKGVSKSMAGVDPYGILFGRASRSLRGRAGSRVQESSAA